MSIAVNIDRHLLTHLFGYDLDEIDMVNNVINSILDYYGLEYSNFNLILIVKLIAILVDQKFLQYNTNFHTLSPSCKTRLSMSV